MGSRSSTDLELLNRARCGDGEAEAELVERYLPLVRHVTVRFGRPGSPLWDDVYAAGCLGLARALKRFDPGQGGRISTYAVPVIIGEIRQYLRRDGAVKLGRLARSAVTAARDLMERRQAATGQRPAVAEIAQEVGMNPADLALALEADLPPRSLDEPAGLEIGTGIDEVSRVVDGLALSQALGQLPDQLSRVVLLRYGRGMTQSETGQVLGLSQSQVSRREREAIDKLREMLV